MKKKALFIILYFFLVFFCLFIMSNTVQAYNEVTYNMTRGYGEESSLYYDRFDIDMKVNSDGTVTISGTMGKNYVPDEATFSGYTFNVDFYDTNYAYIFLLRHNYSQGRYLMYKVPRGSTYYAYNNKKYENGNVYNCAFYCSESYEYWDSTGYIRTYSAGYIDVTNDYSSYALCTNYTDSTLSDVLYDPFAVVPSSDAIFENYEDTEHFSNTLITGEFTYFYFKVPKFDSEIFDSWIYFHDITNIEPSSYDYVNNTSSVYINLNDYSSSDIGNNYIWAYYNDANYTYYAIPSSFPFQGYIDGHTYRLYLLWDKGSGLDIGQKSFEWTTSFTQAGVIKQQEVLNDKTLTQRDRLYDFLSKGDITNDIINLPSLTVSDPTYGFFSNLVYSITDAFYTSSSEETISFYSYDKEYTINSSFFNLLKNNDLSVLKNLLSIIWVVSIGMYLYIDIRKEITRLKEFGWSGLFADDISIDIM